MRESDGFKTVFSPDFFQAHEMRPDARKREFWVVA